MTTRSNAPNPSWSAADTAAWVVAIEAVMARNPDQRGDQLPPCDAPEPDWRSDRDADHIAAAEENRRWRQIP